MRWPALTLALCCAACSFDDTSSSPVACSAEQPWCPTGYRCAELVSRCEADSEERDPPRLVVSTVSPALVSAGDRLSVDFAVDEPLGLPPKVRLVSTQSSVELEVTGSDERHFHAQRDIDGTESEEQVELRCDLVDVHGNVAPGARLGSVVVDFTPPVLTNALVLSPLQQGTDVAFSKNVRFLANLAFDEPLSGAASVEARPMATCTSRAVVPLMATPQGAAVVVETDGAAFEPDCRYEVTVVEVSDLAGNRAPVQQAPLTVRLVRGPLLSALSVSRPSGTEARRFSRVAPYDQFLVAFLTDAALSQVVVSVGVEQLACGLAECSPVAAGQLRCACHGSAQADMAEGDQPLTVAVLDTLGNSTTQSTVLTFDFTAPRVVEEAVQLSFTPPPDAGFAPIVTQELASLGAGGLTVRVRFDEPLAQLPTLETPRLRTLTPALEGLEYVLQLTATSGPDGCFPLELGAVDQVGNGQTQVVPLPRSSCGVSVDFSPPEVRVVDVPRALVHERVPSGVGSHLKGTALVFSGQAITEPVVMRVFSEFDAELLAASLEPGNPTTIPVATEDVRRLRVDLVDRAGNVSPRRWVREIELVAGPRTPGAAFSTRRIHRETYSELAFEPATSSTFKVETAYDGGLATVSGIGSRRPVSRVRPSSTVPAPCSWDFAAKPGTNQLVALGVRNAGVGCRLGTMVLNDDGGWSVLEVSRDAGDTEGEVFVPRPTMGDLLRVDSTGAVSRLSSSDTWLPFAPSPDPAITTAAATFDPERNEVVAFTDQGTYALNGGWRKLADAGLETSVDLPDGGRRGVRRFARLTYDPASRATYLGGGTPDGCVRSNTCQISSELYRLDRDGGVRWVLVGSPPNLPGNGRSLALATDWARGSMRFGQNDRLFDWQGTGWSPPLLYAGDSSGAVINGLSQDGLIVQDSIEPGWFAAGRGTAVTDIFVVRLDYELLRPALHLQFSPSATGIDLSSREVQAVRWSLTAGAESQARAPDGGFLSLDAGVTAQLWYDGGWLSASTQNLGSFVEPAPFEGRITVDGGLPNLIFLHIIPVGVNGLSQARLSLSEPELTLELTVSDPDGG